MPLCGCVRFALNKETYGKNPEPGFSRYVVLRPKKLHYLTFVILFGIHKCAFLHLVIIILVYLCVFLWVYQKKNKISLQPSQRPQPLLCTKKASTRTITASRNSWRQWHEAAAVYRRWPSFPLCVFICCLLSV